jgi:hypothetical protein
MVAGSDGTATSRTVGGQEVGTVESHLATADEPTPTGRRVSRCAMAGLPRIRLHDLRHSYASAGLAAGVELKVIQERLGHSSIATTADLYVHVPPQVDQQAADRTAEYIFGASLVPRRKTAASPRCTFVPCNGLSRLGTAE